MKADITAFRGPDYAAVVADTDFTTNGSKRTMHYLPSGDTEEVAVDLQPIAGLAIVYLPGDVVKWFVGNVELTFTVEEWRAIATQTNQTIEKGRQNTEAANIRVAKKKAHEL